MKNKYVGFIVCMLFIISSIQVVGIINEFESSSINNSKFNLYFDIGIGEPANIHHGDTLFLGENELFATIENFGDVHVYVEVDFLLEFNGDYGWEEIVSSDNGPYDLDPDIWIESFFDVFFDFEGEYRATFSLDTPLEIVIVDWHDDNPDNDVYQVVFNSAITDTNAFATCPRNALYFNGQKLFPIPPLFYGLPSSIVIGGITVEATVENATYPFSYVEFYAINLNGDNESFIDETMPYQWDWNARPGIYFIGVVAKTSHGETLSGDLVFVIKI